jgi:NAD-dependent dihydropyrimidine dehydrogenase PreA subunit
MEGDGPSHGELREVNKIIAGTNGVEVDTVIAAMMGFTPSRLKFLEMANNLGLGQIDLNKIDIVGDFEILPDFKPPLTYLTTKVRVELDEEVCTQCGTCEEVCQAGAMRLDPYPTVDNEKCIYCFCCSEGCPEGALKYYSG